jgi:hypothetical protein
METKLITASSLEEVFEAMNTPTTTPRTDAVTRTFRDPCGEVIGNKIVSADFARQLERELNEARKELHDMAHRQLDDRISALEEAADLVMEQLCTGSPYENRLVISSAIKSFATKLKEGMK